MRYRVGIVAATHGEHDEAASVHHVKEFRTLKGAERAQSILARNGHTAVIMYGALHWFADPQACHDNLVAAQSAGALVE